LPLSAFRRQAAYSGLERAQLTLNRFAPNRIKRCFDLLLSPVLMIFVSWPGSFADARFGGRHLPAGTAHPLGGPGVLNLEKHLSYCLIAKIESIVDFALLGARDQLTLPCTLQISRPEKGCVFSANNGFGRRPIKHLLAG